MSFPSRWYAEAIHASRGKFGDIGFDRALSWIVANRERLRTRRDVGGGGHGGGVTNLEYEATEETTCPDDDDAMISKEELLEEFSNVLWQSTNYDAWANNNLGQLLHTILGVICGENDNNDEGQIDTFINETMSKFQQEYNRNVPYNERKTVEHLLIRLSTKTKRNAMILANSHSIQLWKDLLQSTHWNDDDGIMQYMTDVFAYEDMSVMSYASIRLKDDGEFVKNAIAKRYDNFAYASSRLRDDYDTCMLAVTTPAWRGSNRNLRYASARMQDNNNIVRAAMTMNDKCLEYASDRVRDDYDIVMEAVTENASNLGYASVRLRDNYDIVLAAASKEGYAYGKGIIGGLLYASDRLKDNYDIVLAAVTKCGGCLQWASDRLKDHPDVVRSALKSSGQSLQYATERRRDDESVVRGNCPIHASPRLRDDATIVKAWLKTQPKPSVINHWISPRLQNDKTFMLDCLSENLVVFSSVAKKFHSDKDCVLLAVTHQPESLKFAMNGLNQDRDCLIAAGIWDDQYDEKPKQQHPQLGPVVLSTRFSLNEQSTTEATEFTVRLKRHPYVQQNGIHIYSPNAFDKCTCDPDWTNFDWPCRGTTDTCQMNDRTLRTGLPTNDSCWRYSFRYQLEQAKQSNGCMVQVVELRQNESYKGSTGYDKFHSCLGLGQEIETDMARQVGIKIIRVYQPHQLDRFPSEMGSIDQPGQFQKSDIDNLTSFLQQWHEEDKCTDMEEVDIEKGDHFEKYVNSKQVVKNPLKYLKTERQLPRS